MNGWMDGRLTETDIGWMDREMSGKIQGGWMEGLMGGKLWGG